MSAKTDTKKQSESLFCSVNLCSEHIDIACYQKTATSDRNIFDSSLLDEPNGVCGFGSCYEPGLFRKKIFNLGATLNENWTEQISYPQAV